MSHKHVLWRNSSFIRLWIGNVLSSLGDSAIFILLSWYVIDITGSEGRLGTALMIMALPRILFMLLGGVVADRFQQKNVMALSSLARAIVLLTYSMVLVLMEENEEWIMLSLYVMAGFFGVVDAFFYPARGSIMPFIVEKDHLAAANSVMGASQQISTVTGPLLAALLLTADSYSLMFTLISLPFLIGMLALFLVRQRPQTSVSEEKKETEHSRHSALRELLEGIRYVLSLKVQIIMMFVSMCINLMWAGPVYISLPVMVSKLGWTGETFGYLEAALGIGAIVGGIITGLANGFRGHLLLVTCFLMGMGIFQASLGFMNELYYGLAAMFAAGMMMSMTDIPLTTYMQTVIPSRFLGRVMSLQSMMSFGLIPVSFAIASFLLGNELISIPLLLLVGGLSISALALCVLLFRDFRRLEEHPEWRKLMEQKKPEVVRL